MFQFERIVHFLFSLLLFCQILAISSSLLLYVLMLINSESVPLLVFDLGL